MKIFLRTATERVVGSRPAFFNKSEKSPFCVRQKARFHGQIIDLQDKSWSRQKNVGLFYIKLHEKKSAALRIS
ncbi:MAG TPA: hypothetical protein VH413_19300 [Verrucomicrobiae bacterium]|jgi:hypothetical protein|nr:hypothetical protein [Verrucomicrobiae bacterium]